MSQAGRRHWRVFYLALILVPRVAQAASQTVTLTTISDTVYRADGSFAAGTLLISWPAFTTANGATVAAGTKSVILGTNGSMNVQLAPNVGATPTARCISSPIS
jgi:hypothetical protein